MSKTGQSRHFAGLPMTSGLHSEADTVTASRHVSRVPDTDLRLVHSITLSAIATSPGGTESPSCFQLEDRGGLARLSTGVTRTTSSTFGPKTRRQKLP